MRIKTKWAMTWMTAALAVTAIGCSKEEPKPEPTPARSAKAKPTPPPPALPSSTPAPSATASAPPVDCPKGSSGEGTQDKPCDATGATRLMEVTWTGKYDDEGPKFRVINKSPSVILYGKMGVYFYDKAGKQLDAKSKSGEPRPYHTCTGNMFGGVMKPGEKFTLTFSCVKKDHVPEGATAIEAEMQMVGFSDASEKKVEYYWRNKDLTPDVRSKGGVKKK